MTAAASLVSSSLATPGARKRFAFILVKPSHYDDDGYVIQWVRSAIPSNTLAALYGLAADASDRQALGPGVDIDITAIDETNTRVRPEKLIGMIRAVGGFGMVALVGVQSNQYPHALDLARARCAPPACRLRSGGSTFLARWRCCLASSRSCRRHSTWASPSMRGRPRTDWTKC